VPSAADSRSIRTLIVDPSNANSTELVTHLESVGWAVSPRQVASADELRDAVTEAPPDIVISAHAANGIDAFEALSILSDVRPGCPLIVVTDEVDAHATVQLLRAGAEDVVQRPGLERLGPAAESALSVRQRLNLLSPRQRQVLMLVARGNTSPEIATRLNISVKTVETHRGELMKRIGARDVVGLVHYALRVGLVPNAA
jgi:DNA-binding NarL/FixJ family response regulator